ncbi:MAG: carbamoyltransferase HypF [Acidobacteria bacterium]|nr:MAG: carbamoyltransferase HypF [Acidobacteriota bacterium]
MPEDERSRKTTKGTAHRRLRVIIRGAVQGVGFRPFVYRLATELNLTGWVLNSSQGVFIEVEGDRQPLESFLFRLDRERPPRSFIHSLEYSFLDPVGYARFQIRESDHRGDKTTLVLPDIATCPDCVREIFDPRDRRYRYPFTNCTNCGPRFSIIEALPYDRSNTTMRRFVMCAQCRAEYENPRDRRFHAQPNACPRCGPHLELWDDQGRVLATHHEALLEAAEAIRRGLIVAVKGLGGFHLIVDARRDRAVRRLRARKRREEKPFALMYPSLELVKAHCEVSELEERLLTSPESPIVLLRRKSTRPPDPASEISPAVAPHNPTLGIMLPYTPLHHLLLAELGFPVVATSGNLSDEPICIDEEEALVRLGDIADLFLVHDRPIARHVDDSVVRILLGRELVLRRARGYAPLPLWLKGSPPPLLAVGAHLKNTVALTIDHQVFISQHIGDLETAEAFAAFQRVIGDFQRLYDVRPAAIARDQHPEYLSTRYAEDRDAPTIEVQHHLAHIASCMAENELESPVLGVAWDGTGYGPDGTIWGGEFLRVEGSACVRVASFRTFGLPGGERAIKEPRRSALGLLYELFGAALFRMTELEPVRAFTDRELAVLQTMLQKRLNVPRTSSVGRLFDAVAAIVGRRQSIRFEGQAAMELEFSLDGIHTDATYPFRIVESRSPADPLATNSWPPRYIIDWEPMVRDILEDIRHGVALGDISARFHNTLVETIVAVAERANQERIVLTGGCFQNAYLTERAVRRLRAVGFRPYWHQRIPPNDGGIALGQAIVAGWRWKEDLDGHVSRRSWKDREYQRR